MYEVGELVFYGRTGVCQVADITKISSSITNREELHYILKPMYKECSISIPVENKSVYMRRLISREDVEKLIDKIPHINVSAVYSQNLNQLREYYKRIIESHDFLKMIEMTMSIHKKKKEVEAKNKKLGSVDERFMKEAEELLYGEFAVALEMPRDEVKGYIKERVKRSR